MSNPPKINQAGNPQRLVRAPAPKPVKRRTSFAGTVQEKSRNKWGLIDYHMFLASVESGQDWQTRSTNYMLMKHNGFRRVCLKQLSDPKTFDSSLAKSRLIGFALLPILAHRTPCSTSDKVPGLVLCIDLINHRLQGYFFEKCPEHIADLGPIWREGKLIIDVSKGRFVEMYSYVFKKRELLATGLFNHFRETKHELAVGMDAAVVIKFSQLLKDLSHLLWKKPQEYCDQYNTITPELRNILAKASSDSWLAIARMTLEQYKQSKQGSEHIVTLQLILNEPSPRPKQSAGSKRSSGAAPSASSASSRAPSSTNSTSQSVRYPERTPSNSSIPSPTSSRRGPSGTKHTKPHASSSGKGFG